MKQLYDKLPITNTKFIDEISKINRCMINNLSECQDFHDIYIDIFNPVLWYLLTNSGKIQYNNLINSDAVKYNEIIKKILSKIAKSSLKDVYEYYYEQFYSQCQILLSRLTGHIKSVQEYLANLNSNNKSRFPNRNNISINQQQFQITQYLQFLQNFSTVILAQKSQVTDSLNNYNEINIKNDKTIDNL